MAVFMLASCSHENYRYRIGVSQCSDDEWRSQMNSEIMREALFYDGVQIDIRKANDDSRRQVEDIKYFIEEEVDLLIVAPNEADPIAPVVEDAYNHGIPVIVVDRKISSDKYTAYIGADNYEIGKAVGGYIANMLRGSGKVAEITGLGSSTPAQERHQGFIDALSAYPDIHLVASADGAWLREGGLKEMKELMALHDDFDVLYAHNDRMAAGAYEAADSAGRENKIRFIGIDALPGAENGVESILAGHLDASFIYPTAGDKVMQMAMKILNGQPVPRETTLSTSVVDGTNANIMQMQTAHILSLDDKLKRLNGKMVQFLSSYATQQLILMGSLFALLLVAGLLIAVYKSLRTKNRLNMELFLQKEQLEEQKAQLEVLSKELEAATHAKLVFFTNISHEFRTPLTLIADPIDQLIAEESIKGQPRLLLDLMKKNVSILQKLVNQILDFRKVENGRMDFNPVRFNLLEQLSSWNESFRMALVKKHIAFYFEAHPAVNYNLSADTEKMERIYFNLLSNAVKFTPENGKIRVSLEAEERCFVLRVFNSGSYIKQEELEAIFERFYRVESHHAGTGIGLALVRAFVEMHGGTVVGESNEQGTTFIVTLPRPEEIPEENVSDAELLSGEDDISMILLNMEVDDMDIKDSDKPTVLIIDDNPDIRTYVTALLSGDYRVIEAPNGNVGLKLAMKYVPDIVVSDVMMPGIDGIECCKRLKNEMQTSHIPVILLTACSLDEQRIQGYNGGADSYISKPFNSQVLISRIANLIDNRSQLRQFFGDSYTLEKENLSVVDKDFVTRFKALVEERMKDSELNVEDLGREMGMSRVQLYRKLKSLTNYSPNELLRQVRLKKATSLLAAHEMTVAEVAYEVGFSSPSYFTKCYKEQYGENPTDLLKRKGK